MSEGAEFVEAGTFRVDRKRALEKLMHFQLAEPGAFVLPWVRCAEAGGAEFIRIDRVDGGFEMRFDGLPFTRRELEDPYSALLGPENPMRAGQRHLAIGILGAFRSRPREVSVASGAGRGRIRLRMGSLLQESLTPAPSPYGDTVISVSWPVGTAWIKTPSVLKKIRESCGACRAEIRINDAPVMSETTADGRPCVTFKEDGFYGRLEARSARTPGNGLKAYCFGVFAGNLRHDPSSISAGGYVNDDRWTLNVSQSGIVENDRYRRSMESTSRHTRALLLKALEEHRRLLAERPRISSVDSGLARLRESTRWLLEPCRGVLTDYAMDRKDPVLRTLWEAPLLPDRGSGKSRSLLELDELGRKTGSIPLNLIGCPDDICAESLKTLFPRFIA